MSMNGNLPSAASKVDNGMRSFPAHYDAAIRRDYSYNAPTKDYQRLFCRQTSMSSQNDTGVHAGWLIPDNQSKCKPVFIAHSLLSAIGLVRETLPPSTLEEESWQTLIRAAVLLARAPEDVPPSAQKSPAVVDSDDKFLRPLTTLKRKALFSPTSTQPSSPKRNQISPSTPIPTSVREASPEEDQDAPEDAPPEASPQSSRQHSPVYITTITNNNRRAESKRRKKQAVAQERKRQRLGLQEPAESAEAAEKIAYRTITPTDDPDVAWIIKQPAGKNSDFYTKTKSPYKTACSMLAKARAVGSQDTWYNVATFLQSWRARGTPVPSSSATIHGTVSSQIALQSRRGDSSDDLFQHAWHMSHYCEGRMATVMIEYRWAMALLGRAYANKIDQIQQKDQAASNDASRNRYGKGNVRSEAIDGLLQLVQPDSTPKDRPVFRKRLHRAARWYEAAETLGWGSLTLMPIDTVSHSWVEKEALAGEWSIWLALVKRVNKEAYDASIALDKWLGAEGIQGGSIQSKEALPIEAKRLTVVYEVEEIADSADEDSNSSSIESPAQSPPRTSQPLRQLTLLELFRPQ